MFVYTYIHRYRYRYIYIQGELNLVKPRFNTHEMRANIFVVRAINSCHKVVEETKTANNFLAVL